MCLFKKKKTEPSITMEGETAIFNDGRGRIVRAQPQQLKAIYEVYSGWDVLANDQKFFLVEFDDTLIVVPSQRVLIQELLNTWKREILDNNKGFEAECWSLPFKYRKKIFGFLPRLETKFSIVKPNRLRDFRWWSVGSPLSESLFTMQFERKTEPSITMEGKLENVRPEKTSSIQLRGQSL